MPVEWWCIRWGGFGFGVWRSVQLNGPIWAFALGPLVVYAMFEDKGVHD